MNFGQVLPDQLSHINFALPEEPAANSLVLRGKPFEHRQVFVGCPRWAVKEWVGGIYPDGTKESGFLSAYVQQFNCIELNSTFYNLYPESAIARWAEKAGGTSFKFCPKIFRGISHDGQLDDKLPLMETFIKNSTGFGAHLGPAFLQLADGFGPQRSKELQRFLEALPTDWPLFVELRHPHWFVPEQLNELLPLLRETNKGLLITDTAGRRDVCHMHLAGTKAMVRFVANDLHPTDCPRLTAWASRIAFWLQQGLEEAYLFLHSSMEAKAPQLATQFIERINEKAGLNLKAPQVPPNAESVVVQPSLF